jgi:type IV pilus secretin PilQ/predicted competence protein
MLNQLAKIHYLVLISLFSFLGHAEVTITQGETTSHGNKSSLLIRYTGAQKIQFFAIQGAPGILTLDFPGVVSLFDFTKIELPQVERIEQMPLDPDSFLGVGIHFHLRNGVRFDVYEGEPGALVLYLEEGDLPAEPAIADAQLRGASDVPEQQAPISLATLAGKQRAGFLYGVDSESTPTGLRLLLSIDGPFTYKGFRLEKPERYAIDLMGVQFGLDKRSLVLQHPTILGLRANQFQVQPEPITRLVLDLAEQTEIRLSLVEGGLQVLWGEPMVFSLADSNKTDAPEGTLVSEANVIALNEPGTDESYGETAIEGAVVAGTPISEPVVLSAPEPPLGELGGTDSLAIEEINGEPAILPTEPMGIELSPTEKQAVAKEYKENISVASIQGPAIDPIEAELDAFLEQGNSFYGQMKDLKVKRNPRPIEVTNAAISTHEVLRESRSMQEDAFEGSIFDSVEKSYETIDGGTKKYRGIEIQKIDVKDANVVDLLRFLADQIGFNLYVDPSVKDLKATYRFKNIPWDQAMDIILRNAGLAWEYENDVLRVATTAKFKKEEEESQALAQAKELSVPPETVTFPLNYSKAAEVLPLVQNYLSPRGTILSDERTNTLIIEDIPKRMQAIRTLIKRLDSRIPQVSIEGRVVETTMRHVKEIGVQWGLSGDYRPEIGTETGVTFPDRVGVGGPILGQTSPSGLLGGYAVNFPVISETPSGLGLTLGNFLDNFQLDLSLQMLELNGLGKIISSPKVTTQNNRLAVLLNVEKIPVLTENRGRVTVTYLAVGLELEVTPHVTNDKNVVLDVAIEKSDTDFTRTINGNPLIIQRRAETRVMVKDGGTTVIGGIFVSREQDTKRGIPGLNKIPLVRYLFGGETKLIDNQELLIFLTPRVVRE